MTGPVSPQGSSRAAAANRGRAGTGGWLAYLLVLAGVAAVCAWLWAGGRHAAKGGTLALAGVMFAAVSGLGTSGCSRPNNVVLPQRFSGLSMARMGDISKRS